MEALSDSRRRLVGRQMQADQPRDPVPHLCRLSCMSDTSSQDTWFVLVLRHTCAAYQNKEFFGMAWTNAESTAHPFIPRSFNPHVSNMRDEAPRYEGSGKMAPGSTPIRRSKAPDTDSEVGFAQSRPAASFLFGHRPSVVLGHSKF